MRSVVKISNEQIRKVRDQGNQVTPNQHEVDDAVIRLTDKDLVAKVTESVLEMPDRDDFVAELRQRIADGTYNPTSEEIVDAMARRSIADKMR